jgi:hypothetical protein
MNRALALLLLMSALSAAAQTIVIREGPRGGHEGDDEPGTTRPQAAPQPRAILVNRCVDARGTVVLSDLPCGPAAAAPASAAVPAAASAVEAEVVELSALEARPPREAPSRGAPEAPMSAFLRGLLNGAWKLALLVVGLYALYRGVRHARDRYRERFVVDEPLKRAAGPVRVR